MTRHNQQERHAPQEVELRIDVLRSQVRMENPHFFHDDQPNVVVNVKTR